MLNFYDQVLQGEDKPSVEYQKKYLLQLINTKISQIESKANYVKRIHYVLRILVMIFSGATTVLLGLKLDGGTLLTRNVSNIALIISAVITFLSGLAVFWDTEHYWIRNKVMLNKLKEIRYEYVFYLSGTSEIRTNELQPFLEKFIICLGDEYWEKFLKDVRQVPQMSEKKS